ncbi:MAG: ABC transporter permease [Alphaproteobacteria bacterium]|nr:ABC transporter permease [Alphaproteobacteria bacterium]
MIDIDVFSSALRAEELDVCLHLLRDCKDRGPDIAALNCRLAEPLFHSSRRDEALECGRRAFTLAPEDRDTAHFCAWLFSNCGCHAEAATAYERLLVLAPDWAEGHRHLSGSLAAIGDFDRAAPHAVRAVELMPDDIGAAIHAAELLLRAGHVEQAEELMRAAAWRHPSDDRLLRVLSGIEMLLDRLPAALSAIESALAIAPEIAEYHLHRGHLLYRLGDTEAATAAFAAAATLDPDNAAAKRAQMTAHIEHGEITQATAIGGALLHSHPDDRGAAEAVLHLLNHRLDTIDADYVVLADRTMRPERPPRPKPGFRARLCTQCRVIQALIIRETRTRFGDSKLGYGWALLEPILHITMLSAVFSLMMQGRPPIGTHFFIFYFTGLVPYLMFVHTSSAMSHAITSNGALLQLPLVTTFDLIAARGFLELITDVIVAVILLAGFGFIGLRAAPDDLWSPSIALLVTAIFGCGVGFINAVLTVRWGSWDKIWPQVTRLLYFFSGIFYVPGMMPDWARDALVWNPLLHAIDWFRAGFYAAYQPHWLDRSYLVILTILLLFAGLGFERAMRSRLCEPP